MGVYSNTVQTEGCVGILLFKLLLEQLDLSLQLFVLVQQERESSQQMIKYYLLIELCSHFEGLQNCIWNKTDHRNAQFLKNILEITSTREIGFFLLLKIVNSILKHFSV